jgi:hypothetical protein
MSSVRFDRYVSRATSLPAASLTLRGQCRQCLRAEAARARFGAPRDPAGVRSRPGAIPVERFR